MDQEAARQYHNTAAPLIVKMICKNAVDSPDGVPDVLLLLETVAAGVVTFLAKPGSDDHAIVDELLDGIKGRVAELRQKELARVAPKGIS